jgi:hypothetical protein
VPWSALSCSLVGCFLVAQYFHLCSVAGMMHLCSAMMALRRSCTPVSFALSPFVLLCAPQYFDAKTCGFSIFPPHSHLRKKSLHIHHSARLLHFRRAKQQSQVPVQNTTNNLISNSLPSVSNIQFSCHEYAHRGSSASCANNISQPQERNQKVTIRATLEAFCPQSSSSQSRVEPMDGLVIVSCGAAVWWGLTVVRNRFSVSYPRQPNPIRSHTGAAVSSCGIHRDRIVFSGDTFTALSFLFAASGLLASLVLSVNRNYDQVTSTHCTRQGFVNFAPSVSACIGDFALQRSVWSIAVACYVPPRVATSLVVYYFSHELPLNLARLRLFLFIGEHLSLVLLTVVTSSIHATVHQLGFLFFAMFSMLSMATQCLLTDAPGVSATAIDKAAYKWRRRWAIANVSSFVLAMFWFAVHNFGECAHYLYSYFALFEWMFVLTNVGFHCVELIDLRDHQVHIYRPTTSNTR